LSNWIKTRSVASAQCIDHVEIVARIRPVCIQLPTGAAPVVLPAQVVRLPLQTALPGPARRALPGPAPRPPYSPARGEGEGEGGGSPARRGGERGRGARGRHCIERVGRFY
jgi:hypothetical protein